MDEPDNRRRKNLLTIIVILVRGKCKYNITVPERYSVELSTGEC
jgi:hypothetical protein